MEPVRLDYTIDGDNFLAAGEASTAVKRVLKKLGIAPDIVRRAAVCMYEGEINMVIHASGGTASVLIDTEKIVIRLTDTGPGIVSIERAMQEGFSTASERIRGMGFGAGMGLPNMKRCADDMFVTSASGEGTEVVMTILLDSGKA